MFKKTAFYVGVTLMIQSISMVVLFFLLFAKKKSLASVLLAMAAVGGSVGGVLLYKHGKIVCEEEELISEFLDNEQPQGDEDIEILTDDEVDENEFKF